MTDTNVNIIVVDDDPGDVALLRSYLEEVAEWDVTLVHFTDPENGLAEISRRDDMEVILLDYNIGAVSGLDLLNVIRDSGDIRPIILLTGRADQNTVAAVMRNGADDYIIKEELSPSVLKRSITNARVRYHRRQAERELEEKNILLEAMLQRERKTSREL